MNMLNSTSPTVSGCGSLDSFIFGCYACETQRVTSHMRNDLTLSLEELASKNLKSAFQPNLITRYDSSFIQHTFCEFSMHISTFVHSYAGNF